MKPSNLLIIMSDEHDPRALRHDHSTHGASRRAECHADADLTRPLRHDVRQHAIQPDRRKQRRERQGSRQEHHRSFSLAAR